MKERDLPWIFVGALLISVSIMILWYKRSPGKPAIQLQEETQEEQKHQEPAATEENPAAAAPPAAPVFYRRYHHWTSPTTDQTLTATIDDCEKSCSEDQNCFGVSHDTLTNQCGKLSHGNFDPKAGLLGEYVDSFNVITSMKDRSLKADHMDCFGPYKRENPDRISPTQCPRSREAAVNAYFKDVPALSIFGEMLPGGSTNMLKAQMRAR